MQLISVIVPVYNVEKYLRICLDSILSQTYKELEVILVDDGSKDSSGEICDEYAERHGNFRVIHKNNAGLGMARNSGLEVASGSYVYFLDSDDFIDKYEIERLVQAISSNGVDVCLAGCYLVNDDGKILNKRKHKDQIFYNNEAKDVLLPLMMGSAPGENDSVGMDAAGQLYSMRPIRENGLRFCSERIMVSEDLVFNTDYMQYAHGAVTISSIGYYYRMNPDSLSHQMVEDKFEKAQYFYVEMKKKLINLGYEKDVVDRLTKSFFLKVWKAIEQEASGRSGRLWKERLRVIHKICRNTVTQEAIRIYPVDKMGIKQKIFLILIKYDYALILSLVTRESIKSVR